MAVVKGVKEKVHLPLYDSISVKPGRRLGETLTSNVIRFFQEITGKSKLQTNMQAASLLPHWNTYEARALRVVISDLPAQFPDTPTVTMVFNLEDQEVPPPEFGPKGQVTFSLRHFVDLNRRIEGPDGEIQVFDGPQGNDINKGGNKLLRDLDLKILVTRPGPDPAEPGKDHTTDNELHLGEVFTIDREVLKEIEGKFRQAELAVPTNEQIFPHNGFGALIGKFIYNTVTTLVIGEKEMVKAPTYFFPAGAGPYSEDGRVTTHGYPSPEATFRFAEAVRIETQQNFRVEIEVPESDILSDLQRLYGPLHIWAVLDGYMTRDVQ
jgi:hypothetical protein